MLQRSQRGYYKKLYAKIFENLHEINIFLEKENSQKWNKKNKNMNISLTNKEMWFHDLKLSHKENLRHREHS